jgi:hypothetical protein
MLGCLFSITRIRLCFFFFSFLHPHSLAKAGQRMKLPTPETWETLLSEKGNKSSTWEELIEHKKLPFMAMLRNLRNLIYTGVHPRYHKWVCGKLSNKVRFFGLRFLFVVHSFVFRLFLSA